MSSDQRIRLAEVLGNALARLHIAGRRWQRHGRHLTRSTAGLDHGAFDFQDEGGHVSGGSNNAVWRWMVALRRSPPPDGFPLQIGEGGGALSVANDPASLGGGASQEVATAIYHDRDGHIWVSRPDSHHVEVWGPETVDDNDGHATTTTTTTTTRTTTASGQGNGPRIVPPPVLSASVGMDASSSPSWAPFIMFLRCVLT